MGQKLVYSSEMRRVRRIPCWIYCTAGASSESLRPQRSGAMAPAIGRLWRRGLRGKPSHSRAASSTQNSIEAHFALGARNKVGVAYTWIGLWQALAEDAVQCSASGYRSARNVGVSLLNILSRSQPHAFAPRTPITCSISSCRTRSRAVPESPLCGVATSPPYGCERDRKSVV